MNKKAFGFVLMALVIPFVAAAITYTGTFEGDITGTVEEWVTVEAGMDLKGAGGTLSNDGSVITGSITVPEGTTVFDEFMVISSTAPAGTTMADFAISAVCTEGVTIDFTPSSGSIDPSLSVGATITVPEGVTGFTITITITNV